MCGAVWKNGAPQIFDKKPIAKGGFAWIFACNYEGIEQLQQNTSCAVHCRKAAECRKRV